MIKLYIRRRNNIIISLYVIKIFDSLQKRSTTRLCGCCWVMLGYYEPSAQALIKHNNHLINLLYLIQLKHPHHIAQQQATIAPAARNDSFEYLSQPGQASITA